VVITGYGYSEYVDDALFKTGLCYWKESPRVQRDQQKTTDALSRFSQYRQTFPDGEYAEQVDTYIKQINEKLAQKAFGAARWYFHQKNGTATIVYCDKIIENYPDNRYWARALLLKGDVLLKRGQNEQAIEQFTRVVENPQDPALKREAEERIRSARR
jgi:outer membrane protein assembly factor BamD